MSSKPQTMIKNDACVENYLSSVVVVFLNLQTLVEFCFVFGTNNDDCEINDILESNDKLEEDYANSRTSKLSMIIT